MRLTIASRVLMFVGNALHAQQIPPFPKGASPQFAAITAVDREAGHFVLTTVIRRYWLVEDQQEIIEDGKKKSVTTNAYRLTNKAVQRKIPFGQCLFYAHTGTKLTEREAREKVRAGTIILESTDGDPVDPFYLRGINAETLVLVAPRSAEIEEPPLPVPAPAPAVKGAARKE